MTALCSLLVSLRHCYPPNPPAIVFRRLHRQGFTYLAKDTDSHQHCSLPAPLPSPLVHTPYSLQMTLSRHFRLQRCRFCGLNLSYRSAVTIRPGHSSQVSCSC